jgi:hypothetical protein
MKMRAGTLPALVAGAIAIAVGTLYVSIIMSQSPPGSCSLCEPGVWLIAGYMFAGGALAVASVAAGGARGYLLAAASGAMLFVTAITLISSLMLIGGLPMLLALGLVVRATILEVRAGGTNKASAFALALLLFLGGGGEIATIALR